MKNMKDLTNQQLIDVIDIGYVVYVVNEYKQVIRGVKIKTTLRLEQVKGYLEMDVENMFFTLDDAIDYLKRKNQVNIDRLEGIAAEIKRISNLIVDERNLVIE